MSSMAEMVADLLIKSLPPQVRMSIDWLGKPENQLAIKKRGELEYAFFKGSLTSILANQVIILDNQEKILELLNDNGSGKQRGTKLRAIAGGSGDASGSPE